MKKVIIITGGIASGKSFILELLKELHYPIIKSDEVARDIMSQDSFHKEMSKILNKEKFDLKNLIEENEDILTIVENITYPTIAEIRNKFIEKSHKKSLIPVIEIPLFLRKILYIH